VKQDHAADANVPWASGGTRAMAGGYPDPFGENPGTTCMLTSAVIALRTSLEEQLPQAGGGFNLPTFGEGGLPPGFPGGGTSPNGFPGAPPNGRPPADGGST